ncbi:gp53-like domain-containing protein [Escherichia coli]|nr:hypothetical protein [Escherichia coli]
MHRIDTKTAQKDKFGAGKNGFTRGNPQTGTPATDLDDDYFDMLQEELCSVVEASGASLEKGRHDQLLTALRALLLSRKNPFGDIKSDGTVKTALENLGLGEAAKLPAISGSLSSSGWIKIPVIEGESFIIQWGRIGPSDSKTGVATGSYPIAFPNSAFMAFIAEKTAVSTGPIGINSWGVSELTKTELKAICAARTISTSAATETGDFLVLGY